MRGADAVRVVAGGIGLVTAGVLRTRIGGVAGVLWWCRGGHGPVAC